MLKKYQYIEKKLKGIKKSNAVGAKNIYFTNLKLDLNKLILFLLLI